MGRSDHASEAVFQPERRPKPPACVEGWYRRAQHAQLTQQQPQPRSFCAGSAGVSLAARGATTPRSLVSVLSVPPTPERSLRRNRNKSVRANTWSQQRSKQDAIHSFMNRAVGSKRGSTRSLGLGIKTAAAVPDSPTVPVTRTDL